MVITTPASSARLLEGRTTGHTGSCARPSRAGAKSSAPPPLTYCMSFDRMSSSSGMSFMSCSHGGMPTPLPLTLPSSCTCT